jgi:DNA polymerase-4
MGSNASARICCLDLDTFFVSVERLLDPSLCGKPVVVGALPGHRGVVTAASYEVRAFGVRSGIAISEAVRLAPHAIFLPTRHGCYAPYAERVRAVLERYSPVVQTASIDEFFLDFAGCEALYHSADDRDGDATIERTVREMRELIQAEVGLPASAGIGVTRRVSKIASGVAKPAGVCLVRAGDEARFLAPLPVRKFPGIGPVTEQRLQAVGIRTLGALANLPRGPLRSKFGELAELVGRTMRGQGEAELGRDRPAFLEHDPDGVTVGSISNERTFREDVRDPRSVELELAALAERVCWRARRRAVLARTVTLKLRYADFDTLTRSHTSAPTDSDSVVRERILALYRLARVRPLPVRLVGVKLSNLQGPASQLVLPLEQTRRPPHAQALDAVRARYGYDAIHLGAGRDEAGWLQAGDAAGDDG